MPVLLTRGIAAAVFTSLIVLGLVHSRAVSQSPPSRTERFQKMSESAEKSGLAEPFKGITTNGEIQKGLFEIRSTGVSTEPVRKAAERFLQALTPDQRSRTVFSEPALLRAPGRLVQGDEREAAFALLRASLSARRLQVTRDIMRLNHTLGELNNKTAITQSSTTSFWATMW